MEGLTVVDDPGSRRGPDPTQPWRRLYQATVGALAPGDLDALGFHRQWLADNAGESRDGQAFLRQLAGWTTESGRRTAELAALTARLVPRWGELAQELPKQMLGKGLPTDPLDFTSRLYNATSGPLSAMIRDLLTDDAFLQLLRRLLENWATAESLGARLSEDVFRRLQLATSSDTTRLATLVVGLDEKVDRLEDTIDDLDHGEDARAPDGELARLREQVGRLEEKLDRLLAAGDDGNRRAEHVGSGAGNREGTGR
jgi:polyhydroxyalkanoate synthesis regulator phasin